MKHLILICATFVCFGLYAQNSGVENTVEVDTIIHLSEVTIYPTGLKTDESRGEKEIRVSGRGNTSVVSQINMKKILP